MGNNDINYMRKELDRVQVKMSDFSVKTEYAQSTSDTTPPTTGWSETKPSAEEGKFIWTRNIMNMGYGDVITEPVCIGDGLEHITSLDVEYISWADPYQAPPQSDSGWQTTAPSLTYGHYIWTRTKIITTEQTTYTDPVRVTGELNEELAIGNGYPTSNGKYVHLVYSDVNNPTSWNQCFRYPSNHKYIGILVNTSEDYVTTPSSYNWSAYNETNGYNVGDSKYFHIKYSNNSNGYDAQDNVDMNDKGGLFIGYCTDTNITDPSTPSSYTWIRLEGKGILEIVEYYAEHNRYTTPPETGWSTTPVNFREGYFYWTKSIIYYTDSTTVETTPICVSGVDGSDVWYVYYCSNDTTPPSTPTQSDIIAHPTEAQKYDHWVEDPVPVKSDKKYLYISHANSLYITGQKQWSVFSTPSLWAKYADDGKDGAGLEHIFYLSDDEIGWDSQFTDSGVTGTANSNYLLIRGTRTVSSTGTTYTATGNPSLLVLGNADKRFELGFTIEFDLLESHSSSLCELYDDSQSVLCNITSEGHYKIDVSSNGVKGTCTNNGSTSEITVNDYLPIAPVRVSLDVGNGNSLKFKNLELYPHNHAENPHDWTASQTDDYVKPNTGWTDDATGVSDINPYEYCAIRKKEINGNTAVWGRFDTPSLWGKYGQNGVDGESVDITEVVDATKNEIDLNNIDAVALNGNYAEDFLKLEPDGDTIYQTNGGFIEYKKLGKLIIITVNNWVVYNRGTGDRVPFCTDTTGSTPVQIPEEYRPSSNMYVVGAGSSINTKTLTVRLTGGNTNNSDNGKLSVIRGGFVTTDLYSENISCSFVFFKDNRSSSTLTLDSTSGIVVGDSIKATLTNSASGTALANRTLIFRINNVNYTRVTDSNGQASLKLNLSNGSYSCTVTFNGDSNFSTTTVSTGSFNLAKATPSINIDNSVIKRNQAITGTVINTHGNPLSNIEMELIFKNGKKYKTTTLSDGKFIFNHPNDGIEYNNATHSFNIAIWNPNVYVNGVNLELSKTFSSS